MVRSKVMRIVKWLRDNFWIILLLVVTILVFGLYLFIGNYLYGDDFWKATNMTAFLVVW